MILDSLTKIQVVLAGAKTTLDCPITVDYADNLANGPTPGSGVATTNGVTAVDVLAAPAAGVINTAWRKLENFSLVNKDTGAITATVQSYAGTTATPIVKVTLAVGDQLCYNTARGWYVLDAAGEMRGVSVTTVVASSAVPASATAAGVAGTIAFDATHIYVCISTNAWCKATIATW